MSVAGDRGFLISKAPSIVQQSCQGAGEVKKCLFPGTNQRRYNTLRLHLME
jgi:hypothetical protein